MESSPNPWMLSTFVLIGLIIGYGVGQVPQLRVGGTAAVIQPAPIPTPAAVPEEEPEVVLTEEQIKNLPDDDFVEGASDAPITLVEFSDFQCPFCQKFFSQSFGQIRDNYIKTGKAKFVYRDFPLDFHLQAAPAALAAECAADQNKFTEMHDALFANQSEWAGNSDASNLFKKYAKTMGLDTKTFDACFDTRKHESEIKKDLVDGISSGVSGTPGFFVNGKALSGALPYEEVFKSAFEAELAGKKWELKYNLQTRRPYIEVTGE